MYRPEPHPGVLTDPVEALINTPRVEIVSESAPIAHTLAQQETADIGNEAGIKLRKTGQFAGEVSSQTQQTVRNLTQH